ncbi:MAG: response regulator [Polyangiaceae bacterium]
MLETKSDELYDSTRQLRAMNAAMDRQLRERALALETSLAWFQSLVAALPLGIVVESEAGRIDRVNKPFRELFGIAAELPCEGASLDVLVRAMLADGSVDAIAPLREGALSRAERGATHLDTRDGRVVELTCAPMSTADGMSLAWIMRDVTELVRARETLEEARRLAESSNAAKVEFLAMLSHELRTPAAALLGLIELAQGAEPAAAREFLARAGRSGRSLARLVQDVLDFARLEAGSLRIASEPFDPRRPVEDAHSALESLALDRSVTLAVSADPKLPSAVMGDGSRIAQVVINLANNALKLSGPGQVRLDVRLSGPPDAPLLEYSVTDRGPGLSPPELERLFEPFTPLERDRRVSGVGMGLSIVDRLAKAMGGRIEVSSRPGEGSRFALLVPYARATVGRSTNDYRLVALRLPAGTRVLVVDDDPNVRFVLRALIERSGASAFEASTGERALEQIEQGPFDAVVSDLAMPRMDGIELVRAIRAAEARTGRPKMRVVVVSAHALEAEQRRALEAGADVYVTKPVRPDVLLSALGATAEAAPAAPRVAAARDPDVVRALPRYLLRTRTAMAEARAALGAGDVSQASTLGHKLAGSGGSYGLDALSELGAALERAGRTGSTSDVDRALSEVERFVAALAPDTPE